MIESITFNDDRLKIIFHRRIIVELSEQENINYEQQR